MNKRGAKSANRLASRVKDGNGNPFPATITHCVACNYESMRDFDICPRCKARGRSVLVVKHA